MLYRVCYVAVCNNYAICNILQTGLNSNAYVIQRISNCAVRATRFVMYYKLCQNFIIIKILNIRKKIDKQQNTSLQLYLAMDSARHQSIRARHAKLPINTTFGQNTTLFCPRTFAKSRGALKPIRPSVYWFVCPSLCLSQKL